MIDAQALVKTLDFQLNIQSDNEGLLSTPHLKHGGYTTKPSDSPKKAWTGTPFPTG